jgi:hypothetical protein
MFEKSTGELRETIRSSGVLVKQDEIVPPKIRQRLKNEIDESPSDVCDLIPYLDRNKVMNVTETEQLTLDKLNELNSMKLLK